MRVSRNMIEIELERQLKTLANRRRLAILNLLRKRKDANVSDIADSIKLSLTSTSKHLTMLERMEFVEKEQKSLNVYYRIASNRPDLLSKVIEMF
jgi:DNA-binding transcriptional ArsR family regulator